MLLRLLNLYGGHTLIKEFYYVYEYRFTIHGLQNAYAKHTFLNNTVLLLFICFLY